MPNLRHSFVSTKSDSADSSLVRPTDWNAALQYTNGSGAPSGTDATIRETLTADRTYYVRTDGSNSNSGLANTAGGAFLTLQYAYDYICANLDFAGYTVTIQVADGTYTTGVAMSGPWTGGGTLLWQGNTGTPANAFINSSASCFSVTAPLPGAVTVDGFKLASSAGSGLVCNAPAVLLGGRLNFGTCASAHAATGTAGATIALQRDYTISGGANAHMQSDSASLCWADGYTIAGFTVTLSGTPAFATAFASASATSNIYSDSQITYSGGATGPRYSAISNAVVSSGGGGASFFPGNSAGSTATGGQYL